MVGIDDNTKKRIAKRLSRQKSTAVSLTQQADQKIERLLIRRFDRLISVRRFVFLWVLLFLVMILAGVYQIRGLSAYYQQLRPEPGGIYTEGLIGNFTNANPLFATGAADTAVSRLVFSGLFKYDSHNQLVGDLAQYYSLSHNQQRYTVRLKKGLTWQDGQPFTAADVVFTYQTIQNIEAQSPLYSSWQGINVTAADNYTVNFDLPNALSDFPYSLTNGIVPAHLLRGFPVEQLRSAPFNTSPIGTGPFEWKFIEVTGQGIDNTSTVSQEQRISLAAFDDYADGRPKLDGFNLIAFGDDQHMIDAFKRKQISAMSGLENLPPALKDNKGLQVYVTPLTSEVMVFFNMSRPVTNDAAVRRALAESVGRSQLSGLFDEPVKLADSPLLKGQLGYNSKLVEPRYNLADANKLLDKAGWKKGPNGIRAKKGQQLTFVLSAQDSQNYTMVAHYLQSQWQKIGVKLQVQYYSQDDIQTSVVNNHDYDALLYAVNIGVDPDVYAYWDSSQASITSQGHLNLSEYKSTPVDQALEAGRTRSDPSIRAVKYQAFLRQWTKDLPAVSLYQPDYLYITRGEVFNFESRSFNSGADRFYNVNNWMIRQKRQTIK
ncbi:MAG TPA: peptide ABC transporter substrate-binding protein [Candidatus Saccharimonadales bacterium]|nr:peptide ABC transporter substrate-binding protein [Candidatus Saccharimonadales bacterium]